MITVARNEAETETVGEAFAKELKAGDCVAMRGDLGAGKTAFCRGLARGLGYSGRVTSPTYALVNEYEGDLTLFHFDLYRLSCADELYDLGLEEYLDRGGVCVMEWSERVEGEVPFTHTVTVKTVDAATREITIEVR